MILNNLTVHASVIEGISWLTINSFWRFARARSYTHLQFKIYVSKYWNPRTKWFYLHDHTCTYIFEDQRMSILVRIEWWLFSICFLDALHKPLSSLNHSSYGYCDIKMNMKQEDAGFDDKVVHNRSQQTNKLSLEMNLTTK